MHEIRLATTLVHQYSLSNLDTMANGLYHVINAMDAPVSACFKVKEY